MNSKCYSTFDKKPVSKIITDHQLLIKFINDSGLANFPSNSYVIFGSFIRSLLSNEKINNVNVAFIDSRCISLYNNYEHNTNYKIEVEYTPSVIRLLNETDFTICQIMYYDGYIYFCKDYFEHYAKKVLFMNCINSDNPLKTLLRAYKYNSRGYNFSAWDLIRISKKIKNIHWTLSSDEIFKHSDGLVF